MTDQHVRIALLFGVVTSAVLPICAIIVLCLAATGSKYVV